MKIVKKLVSKKSFVTFMSLFFMIATVLFLVSPVKASFNANNVMDNGVFDNSGTMNATQIDNWLNSNFGSAGCLGTDHGFSAPQPIGYSPTGPSATGGFSYGSDVSAGTVIYDAATAYGLNPQVILTMLQAQESLLNGTGTYGCTATAYTQAMGYDCPNTNVYNYSGFELYSINGQPVTSTGSTGTCVNNATTAGFSRQVVVAAWQLKFDEERAQGNVNWNVQLSNFPNSGDVWDNSDDPPSCYPFFMTQGTYARSTSTNPCPSSSSPPGNQLIYYDGSGTLADGTTVQFDNGATASLYDYTPFIAGNEEFDSVFEQYFGGIYAQPYVASYYSQSSYPRLSQGQQTTVTISYQNLGSQPWYDNNSLSSAPSGTYPVHLSTGNPVNSASLFSSGWPSSDRPALNFSAVYLSDGQTLASNQNVVQPGEIGQFSFTITDPQTLMPGTYQQYFQPVAEGSSQYFNNPGTFLDVTVLPTNNIALYSQATTSQTIYPSDNQNYSLMFTNTGNVPLYDSQSIGSAPPGNYPTHLAISCPMNTNSPFATSNWANPSRPAINFAAVYESNGTTLAPNQNIAEPGQIVKFSFNFQVPANYAAGSYATCLQPVLEGTSSGTYSNLGVSTTIVVPTASVLAYSGNSTPVSAVSGEPGTDSFTITNVGNSTLASGSIVLTSNGAAFQSPSWTSSTNIETISSSLAAGASTTISVPYLSPTVSNNTTTSLAIYFNDSSSNLVHDSNVTLPFSVAAPIYSASYAGESPYPTLSYGETGTIYFKYKNTGNKPWYDNNSLSTAVSRSPLPVHLATNVPMNRPSGFDYNWPSPSRPALNFSTVYDSNGTTLASNQNVVQPGQIGEFSFQVAVDNGVGPGTYTEYFQPIVEGTAGEFNFQWTFENITVTTPVYSAKYYSQSSYPTLTPGGSSVPVYFEYTNTGNVPWYDSTSYSSAPGSGNLYPVHLSTSHPINSSSIFDSGWFSSSRPALNFSAVYESNGTTLAPNQHVVMPGEIGKFSFNMAAPSGLSSGTYREFFQPIAEGSMYGEFNDPWTSLNVSVN